MTTDEKGNPLTYWDGLEETMENRIKGINVDTGFRIEISYSEEEVVSFIHKFIKEHQPQLPYLIGGINMWFQQYKKK